MEVALVIVAAGSLLGCFAAMARIDMSKPRAEARPLGRCIVR